MNILEQAKDKEFIKEQFVKGRILDDTKDYGRTQFVDEIYRLQQENQQLKEKIENAKNQIDKFNREEASIMYTDTWEHLKQILEILEDKEEADIMSERRKNEYLETSDRWRIYIRTTL